MGFWGIEIKPGETFTHRFDKAQGKLHITQATLGTGRETDMSAVQCNVGDKGPVFICGFSPYKSRACQLNLEFEEEDDVVFSVVGPLSVHLTGFFRGYCHCKDGPTPGTRRPSPLPGPSRGLVEPFGLGLNLGLIEPFGLGPNRGLVEPFGTGPNRGLVDPFGPGYQSTWTEQIFDTIVQAAEAEKRVVDVDHVANEDHSEVNRSKKSKFEESEKNANTENDEKKGLTLEIEDKKAEAKSSKVWTLATGIIIEEDKRGIPNGIKATPGTNIDLS